jgi:hypothetical protein
MTRRRAAQRVLAVGLLALLLGAADSLVKGEGSGLLGALSRTASPWLLLAFLAGALTSDRRLLLGAFTGLEATLLALIGFYFVNSLIFPIGSDSWLADFHIALLSGKVYFELAIFSGPLFGAFGAWWRQQLSMVPVIMVGMLFLVEALAHASQTSALVQYADQVAGIEVLVGALWTVLALNKTKVLRHDVGADRAP